MNTFFLASFILSIIFVAYRTVFSKHGRQLIDSGIQNVKLFTKECFEPWMDCLFEKSAIEDPTLLLPFSELCLVYGPDYWIEDYNYAELPLYL